MAEPVSALPNPPIPKGEAVSWPDPAVPLTGYPDISGSNSATAVPAFSERLNQGLQDSYARFQSTASDLLERSRRRFRYMAEERPMQIVIGVAIASLLTGAALRIWRGNHD